MTRKDFVLIAAALYAASASRETCEIMADHLALASHNFDRAKFLAAAYGA